MATKLCIDCGEIKDIECFPNRGGAQSHLYKSYCIECGKARNLSYYHNNRDKQLANAKIRNDALREQSRAYVAEYFKNHPCVDCGNADWRVLEFDHVRGSKLHNICDIMAKPIQLVIDEIAKCESVCANCHKIRTFTRAGSWRSNYEIK